MVTRALPYRPHNHQACVNQALDDARHICQQHNARLTPTRQRVLELIWQSHRPLGAYDVLAQLAAEGQNAAPPTVYRALDFLQQHGLVHRIASLNARRSIRIALSFGNAIRKPMRGKASPMAKPSR